jgi:hypothetical protein
VGVQKEIAPVAAVSLKGVVIDQLALDKFPTFGEFR